jgi:hypothetical protein
LVLLLIVIRQYDVDDVALIVTYNTTEAYWLQRGILRRCGVGFRGISWRGKRSRVGKRDGR